MLYFKFRNGAGQLLVEEAGSDVEAAQEKCQQLCRNPDLHEVELLIDLETADETAAALTFAPIRVESCAVCRTR